MSEAKNQEQLEGVGAAYTMLKQLFEGLIKNAEEKRTLAWVHKSVRGIAYCDSTIQFLSRCLEHLQEDFTEFIPFAPLPVDENGNPYFPPGAKIMVANLEVRPENQERLRLSDYLEEPK